MFKSSTITVPPVGAVPRHVAIIMDGNGRWAKSRFLPRVAGHKRGLEAVRAVTKACVAQGVQYLTLFAFSSENWRRPKDEVSFLMELFVIALEQEVAKLLRELMGLPPAPPAPPASATPAAPAAAPAADAPAEAAAGEAQQ